MLIAGEAGRVCSLFRAQGLGPKCAEGPLGYVGLGIGDRPLIGLGGGMADQGLGPGIRTYSD